jgi:hypothetical protein
MYVFLAIIGLAILLLLPIRINLVYYEKETSLIVKYLFFKISILKLLEKRKKKNEKKAEIQPKAPQEPKEKEPQLKTRDVLEHLKRIFSYIKWEFSFFRKKVVFNKLHFSVAFSTGDAATTAVSYGAVCTLVYNFFSCFYYNFKIIDKNITVIPYYTDSYFKADCHCNISIRLIWVIVMAIVLAWAAVDILSKIKGKHKKIKVGEQI